MPMPQSDGFDMSSASSTQKKRRQTEMKEGEQLNNSVKRKMTAGIWTYTSKPCFQILCSVGRRLNQ
uniref:Uncharacterized protein n=1 Tax=Oryzias sinensis TaxID=183150 RepID=A0A8C8DN94_9TELE